MKKKIAIIALALLSVACAVRAEFRWGPTAGLNISDLHFKQPLIDSKLSAGPMVGVIGEMMFPGIGFGIDFGLRWQMGGGKVNLGQKEVWASDGYGNEHVWIHSLQVPVNLRFKYTNLNGIEDIVAPLVFAGPVFSLTVGHNGVDALEYPAGYVGVQCGLGAELWHNFQVTGSYMWGVSYVTRTRKLDNFSARQNSWNVNFTYLF